MVHTCLRGPDTWEGPACWGAAARLSYAQRAAPAPSVEEGCIQSHVLLHVHTPHTTDTHGSLRTRTHTSRLSPSTSSWGRGRDTRLLQTDGQARETEGEGTDRETKTERATQAGYERWLRPQGPRSETAPSGWPRQCGQGQCPSRKLLDTGSTLSLATYGRVTLGQRLSGRHLPVSVTRVTSVTSGWTP